MDGFAYLQLLNPMMMAMFAFGFHLIGKLDRRGVAHAVCVGYALGALGFALEFFLRDTLSSGSSLSILLGNIPLLLGSAAFAYAMHLRYGRPFPSSIAATIVAATILLVAGLTVADHTGATSVVAVNIGIGLLFLLALNAFRDRVLAALDKVLVTLFVLATLQFLVRPLAGLSFGSGLSALRYNDPTYMLTLHFTVAIFSMSIAMTMFFALGTELVGRLSDAVRSDPMTDLLNRRGLEEAADEVEEEARSKRDRSARLASVVITDIDHFKSVNDRFGHAAGDVVIRAFASVLEGTAREQDLVARIGGEEFVVVLPETRPEVARLFAEGVRTAFGEIALDAVDRSRITASFGVAEWRPGTRLDQAIDVADSALYEAKNAGRNCVRVADVDPNAEFLQPAFRQPARG